MNDSPDPISSAADGDLAAALSHRRTRRDALRGAAGGIGISTGIGIAIGIAASEGTATAAPHVSPARAADAAHDPAHPSRPARMPRSISTPEPGAHLPDDLVLPASLADAALDPAAGFAMDVGGFTANFVPIAGVFGPDGDLAPLRAGRMTIGAIVTCLGDVWRLESAPDASGRLALAAWADAEAAGRPLAMLTGAATIGPRGIAVSLTTPAALLEAAGADDIAAEVTVDAAGTYAGKIVVKEDYFKHGPCHHRCKDAEDGGARRCRRNCKHHMNRKRRRHHHRR